MESLIPNLTFAESAKNIDWSAMESVPFNYTVAVGALCLGAALFYHASIPKPLPGIPFVAGSDKRMFGDLPPALAHESKTGLMFTYIRDNCIKLNSPVVQLFFRPFSSPWIAVCDGREAQDIMTHRTKEFDRSPLSGDLVRAHAPQSQLPMLTNEQWRFNRQLIRDTMSPKFLNSFAAAKAHEAGSDLVKLWKQKTRLAEARTFDVKADVLMAVVDVIWSASFGSDIDACKTQLRYLEGVKHVSLPKLIDDREVVNIPACDSPEAYAALITLFDSSIIPLKSPFGYHHHWLAMKVVPRYRRAMSIRDRLVKESIRRAYRTFADKDTTKPDDAKSAVDFVVEREVASAAKEGRPPMQANIAKYIHDELCLFLSAGSTTTAEAICWGLKYLTAHQDIQQKIREHMNSSFSQEFATGSQLTASDIAESTNPFLEAFMYESLRHGTNMEAHLRVALSDTQILGHHIPKGTNVILVVNGPSLTSPAMPVDETKRSNTSKSTIEAHTRQWRSENLETFIPERWLITNAKGETEFDPRAAPMQTFGAGPRSCFGQKFAMLEMRIIYSLILWNFELLPIHESLREFQGVEVLTLQPRHVRVKLRELHKK
ncbi:cytochrome p450 domain-containing protein [Sarocladium implicatum]|nr:cytochrome p450 domain-containing protein [Sarocladium implicatum]